MADISFGSGDVWLVGAGPGDPDLLTRKAERLLAMASIVFHDALVSQAILDLIPRQVMQVPVGKRAGRHSMSQPAINGLLVKSAQNGHRVVRLKGGDPAVFGRMTEEVDALQAEGIRVQVCPGITAASAAAASGVLSLTRRGSTRALTFITAQGCGNGQTDIDWSAIAGERTTLAIYMGRAAAPHIEEQLIANGLLPSTPILIAVNVSSPDERLIRGRLDSLALLMAAVGDRDPALLLMGDVTHANAETADLSSEWLDLPTDIAPAPKVRIRA
jgi:uroporphyrin-III C-methyltransferase